MEALLNKTIQEAAKELAMEAVKDVVRVVKKSNGINIIEPKKLIDKLESIKFSVMFSDDIIKGADIDKLYKELPINETSSFVEMFIEMKKHSRKLKAEEGYKFTSNVDQQTDITYLIEENVLGNMKNHENLFIINTISNFFSSHSYDVHFTSFLPS